ncbi:MAG: TonB-dependent receptor, partial [Candidatus Sulfotelmatobacter sp.]
MMKQNGRTIKNLASFFIILGLLAFGSRAGWGQAEAGSIVGTVHDSTGALISSATVETKSVTTGAARTTVTGNAGQYSIPGLTPGKYEVTISNKGFQTFKSVVEVTVGGITTVDAQLSIGQSSTVVEVSASSAGTEVNTQTQELSQLINTQQLAQLPSLTRNPYDFVAISGNVSNGDTTSNGATMSSGGGGQELSSRGVGFSINGQRESGTEILLDGVENIAIFSVGIGENIPIDGVQEYSIVTNNFAAEYGRASGGVVNVTTKSGTNAFHGSVWEFNRLAAYTANTYNNDALNNAFLAGGGTGPLPDPKGGYTRNQFGFQVGGPIIKNKLFVSESTEFTRVRSNSVQHAEIFDPTFIAMLPANAKAYFSAFGATSGLTSGGPPITAGELAANAANPLIVNPINGITPVAATQPIFDPVNFTVPYNDGGGPPQNTWSLVGRLDYNLSDKTQMFFRIGRERLDAFNGTNEYTAYSQYDSGTLNQNMIYLFSVNHAFNNNILNNTKLSFARYNDGTSYNTAYQSVPNLMFYPGADPLTGAAISTPGLENSNSPGTGGLPAGGPQNTIQFENDLSWTKGKHNVRVGGQYTYIQLNYGYGAYAQAVEQLGGSQQDSMDDLVNFGGNPGGSILSGSSGFSARVNPNGALPCPVDMNNNPVSPCPADSVVTPPLTSATYGRSYRYNDWALYAQDSFRFTPRLTLNYGMRYEHYGVQHNNDGSLDSNFYLGSGTGFFNQVRAGQVEIADKSSVGQFWAPSWGTAAPRVGFAYDLFGDGKSSLRGGFGISYERNFGNVTYNASFNPPASAVLSTSCPARSATCTSAYLTNNDLGPLGLPGPSSNLPPTELRDIKNSIHVAQTQFWSLSLQRQLVPNTVMEIGYSGAHGVHLYDLNNINLPGAGQAYLGDPAVAGTDVNPGSTTCNPAYVSPTGVCLTRPNSQYSAINQRGSGGTSSYNALNVRLQTQNLHNTGVSMVANYTWAHSLDDISSTFSDSLQGGSGNGYGSLGYTLVSDPKLDWGNSDYDVRQRFVISPIWETPWYKSERGLGEALGGWSLVGVFTARSGIPFNAYDLDNDYNFYTFPRLTPATAPTYHVSSNPTAAGPNLFNLLTLPLPASFAPDNPTLGISDFGPFPAGMVHR